MSVHPSVKSLQHPLAWNKVVTANAHSSKAISDAQNSTESLLFHLVPRFRFYVVHLRKKTLSTSAMLRGIVSGDRAKRGQIFKTLLPTAALVAQSFNPELFYLTLICNFPLLVADCLILGIQDPKIPSEHSQHQYRDCGLVCDRITERLNDAMAFHVLVLDGSPFCTWSAAFRKKSRVCSSCLFQGCQSLPQQL